MAARHLRTIVGTVVLAMVVVAVFAQHVWPWHELYTWQEIGSNVALVIVGLLLVDRASGIEVLGAVKEKIPLIGKPKA